MNKVKQEVVWYNRNYAKMELIVQDMRDRIKNGWRVHTCLDSSCDVLIVYEKGE